MLLGRVRRRVVDKNFARGPPNFMLLIEQLVQLDQGFRRRVWCQVSDQSAPRVLRGILSVGGRGQTVAGSKGGLRFLFGVKRWPWTCFPCCSESCAGGSWVLSWGRRSGSGGWGVFVVNWWPNLIRIFSNCLSRRREAVVRFWTVLRRWQWLSSSSTGGEMFLCV